MRQPQGYLLIVSADSAPKEADTFTCKHCQQIVIVKPLASPSESGGWCSSCSSLICGPCADKGVCTPWEKLLERAEARDRFLRSAGL